MKREWCNKCGWQKCDCFKPPKLRTEEEIIYRLFMGHNLTQAEQMLVNCWIESWLRA